TGRGGGRGVGRPAAKVSHGQRPAKSHVAADERNSPLRKQRAKENPSQSRGAGRDTRAGAGGRGRVRQGTAGAPASLLMDEPANTPKLRMAAPDSAEEIARRFEREQRTANREREFGLEQSLAG